MKKLSKRRIPGLIALLLGLALMIMTLSLAVSAEGESRVAIDLEAPISIDIEYPVDDVDFRLYRVADLSADGATATLTGEFAQFAAILPITDTDDFFSSYLSILVDYVGYYELEAVATGRTAEGHVNFQKDADGQDIYPGVYLALCDKVLVEDLYYICDPMMFCAPNRLATGDSWDYAIEISGKYLTVPQTATSTWLQITKRWDDEGFEEVRPESIRVALMRDGVVEEEVDLNAESRWTYTWENLDGTCWWSVAEVHVPEGYVLTKDTTYSNQPVVINEAVNPPTPPVETLPPSETPTPTPDVPQTGVLWWPVPLLFAMGLTLFIIGLLKQRREDV